MLRWIEINGVHINMGMVRSFWWDRIDGLAAYLYLAYGDGDVVTFEDPYQTIYRKVCNATCQNMSERCK